MKINLRDIILSTLSAFFLIFIVSSVYSNPTLLQKNLKRKKN